MAAAFVRASVEHLQVGVEIAMGNCLQCVSSRNIWQVCFLDDVVCVTHAFYITKPLLECLEQKALLLWSPPLSMQTLSREEPNRSFNLNQIEKLIGAMIQGWEK